MALCRAILLIEKEEDLRIAAKIFLAERGIFIDTSPCLDHRPDISAYKAVIITDQKVCSFGNAVFLEKPYTAFDLLNIAKKALL